MQKVYNGAMKRDPAKKKTEYTPGSVWLGREVTNMKKRLLAMLMAGAMALSLTACGGTES